MATPNKIQEMLNKIQDDHNDGSDSDEGDVMDDGADAQTSIDTRDRIPEEVVETKSSKGTAVSRKDRERMDTAIADQIPRRANGCFEYSRHMSNAQLAFNLRMLKSFVPGKFEFESLDKDVQNELMLLVTYIVAIMSHQDLSVDDKLVDQHGNPLKKHTPPDQAGASASGGRKNMVPAVRPKAWASAHMQVKFAMRLDPECMITANTMPFLWLILEAPYIAAFVAGHVNEQVGDKPSLLMMVPPKILPNKEERNSNIRRRLSLSCLSHGMFVLRAISKSSEEGHAGEKEDTGSAADSHKLDDGSAESQSAVPSEITCRKCTVNETRFYFGELFKFVLPEEMKALLLQEDMKALDIEKFVDPAIQFAFWAFGRTPGILPSMLFFDNPTPSQSSSPVKVVDFEKMKTIFTTRSARMELVKNKPSLAASGGSMDGSKILSEMSECIREISANQQVLTKIAQQNSELLAKLIANTGSGSVKRASKRATAAGAEEEEKKASSGRKKPAAKRKRAAKVTVDRYSDAEEPEETGAGVAVGEEGDDTETVDETVTYSSSNVGKMSKSQKSAYFKGKSKKGAKQPAVASDDNEEEGEYSE